VRARRERVLGVSEWDAEDADVTGVVEGVLILADGAVSAPG
jgi:hypothetical protein